MQDVLSTHLTKLGIEVNAAILPDVKDISLVPHLCNLTLCERGQTEVEELPD